MNTATLANTLVAQVNSAINAATLRTIETAPRYRNREFGVGYGRSEGYARRHTLWQGASRSRYA